MKRPFWRKNDGLTLVELMVSIAIGTMIFAAATTVLLLGIRVHHHTTDSIMQQYTARTVITVLEDLASDGDMGKIKRNLDGSWWVYDKTGQNEVMSYSSLEQAVYTGGQAEPILENIIASYLVLDQDKNMLTISLEDQETAYTSSVFCRYNLRKDNDGDYFEDAPNDHLGAPSDSDEDIAEHKSEFLAFLLTQVSTRAGIINHDTRTCGDVCEKLCHRYNFFSQWYSNGYDEEYYPGWNTETPWCGCFVSWGLCHASGLGQNKPGWKWFGNVDEFMDYFRKDTTGGWKTSNPGPGDLVFFDMINGTTDNPSHIGAVLDVIRENPDDPASKIIGIKTIEGNSADTVAIREYQIGDKRILGYGDPWAAQAKPNDNT